MATESDHSAYRQHPHGPIVVGIDGSAHGDAALRWAYDEALVRGCGLRVVYVFERELPPPVPLIGLLSRTLETEDPDAVLAGCLTRALPALRQVRVEAIVVRGPHPRSLVDACTDAQLLVVGTRGRSVIGRAVLGSTSSYCAHHAPCPVIVVPMPHPAEGELPAPRAAHPQPEAHPAS